MAGAGRCRVCPGGPGCAGQSLCVCRPGTGAGYRRTARRAGLYRGGGKDAGPGAEYFLFETLSSDAGVLEAVRAIRARCPMLLCWCRFAALPDGYTQEGLACSQLLQRMQASGLVDAAGLNCVSAPGAMAALVQQLGRQGLPLSVMPNAGYPVVARSQVRYQGKPAYFAKTLAALAGRGVRILGGCCGTTPEHIQALTEALEEQPALGPAFAEPGAVRRPISRPRRRMRFCASCAAASR